MHLKCQQCICSFLWVTVTIPDSSKRKEGWILSRGPCLPDTQALAEDHTGGMKPGFFTVWRGEDEGRTGTRHSLHRNVPFTYLASQRLLPKVSKTSSKLIPRILRGTFHVSTVVWSLAFASWGIGMKRVWKAQAMEVYLSHLSTGRIRCPLSLLCSDRVFLDAF